MTKPLQKKAYLVGIKGVALTAMAEILIADGWVVEGSDVVEDFVTAEQLAQFAIKIHTFSAPVPKDTNLLIYTGAHHGEHHPQVLEAKALGIRCLSHAQALAEWFNRKQTIAVCGVGGKSSISAMIAWILEKTHQHPSYSVGVGKIIDLKTVGQWTNQSDWAVVEADEYAQNPTDVKSGAQLIPRFSYLKPNLIVASRILYDHPDVYINEEHTWRVFTEWFKQSKLQKPIITHIDNIEKLKQLLPNHQFISYGFNKSAQARITSFVGSAPKTQTRFIFNQQAYSLELQVPGQHNVENALAAILATHYLNDTPIGEACLALASFRSTFRRFEYKGKASNCELYDDYAHHPREIFAVLEAAKAWVGEKKLIVAFQPHTYSRTRRLWNDFVQILAQIDNLYLLKIFPSARESEEAPIEINTLADEIKKHNAKINVNTSQSIDELAKKLSVYKTEDAIILTLGAGDIYQVHDLILK